MSRFYVTTPIYYVNAKPHLGHAYTTIVADALARFHRVSGDETFFLTGTDEHGDKIAKAAEEAGQSPKEYVDTISALYSQLWPQLSIKNDAFIRTTEAKHIKCVQDILQKVYDTGDIYFGEYGGHYCFGCERFYTEKELENGLCPQHQTKPEFISEKNYFFRMSKYQDWLLAHIEANPDFIRPEGYRNEVVSLLKSGALEDLCISRPKSRLNWGIELPFDTNFVCYVWFDALLNYVSALGSLKGDKFRKFWPAANHLVAKDILKPHAVFWPTMLKAAGLEPYKSLNVHGYWLVRDTKMSKSLGNVVAPLDMAGKYGVDAFRYFLLREMAFGQDASFSEDALIGRLNADLANDLGNLVNRSLSMTHKFFGGKVPEPGEEGAGDAEIKALGRAAMEQYQALFAEFKFSRALEALWDLVRGLNKYIDATAPWTLAKNNKMKRLGSVMFTVLEHLRKLAVHLWPVMPGASEAMLKQLGMDFDPAQVNIARELDTWGILHTGHEVAAASNLFPRVELPELAPAKAKAEAPAKTEAPEAVEFEDFQKMDLRVGLVVGVAKHPDADKLYLVDVDLGEPEPRRVVAGLADFFAPNELMGKQVVVVANLKPRKLRGQKSHGMILVVKDAGGMALVTAHRPTPAGGRIS